MKAGLAYRSKINGERGMVYADKLLDVVKNTAPTTWAPVWGDGSLENPYRPTQSQHWAWLASRESGADPMFIVVGERVIARWGSSGGYYKDYATDVTEWEGHVRGKILGKERKDVQAAIKTIADAYKKIDDEELHLDPDWSVYTRKALRVLYVHEMTETYAAQKSRELLQGLGTAHECPELANTLVALFVCEAHRSPATFAISLMLLDLVETSTTYGRGGEKTYTWKSMLMHHVNDQSFAISGRGSSSSKPLGKHPMAGAGTASLGRNLVFGQNMVSDRVISIAAVWLAHYETRTASWFDFFIIQKGKLGQTTKKDKQTKWKKENDGWLQSICGHAIGHRLATLNLLIGGTTVYYEDIDGNRV